MAIVSNIEPPARFDPWQTVDGIAYPPPEVGAVNHITGSFDFEDTSAKTMFYLPVGAYVLFTMVDINTAFNAGTTNTFDVGLASTADALVDGGVAGAIARLFPVQDVPTIAPLTASSAVTATYIPSGTAASTGAATVTVFYGMVQLA